MCHRPAGLKNLASQEIMSAFTCIGLNQSCIIQVQVQLVCETQTVYWFIGQEFSIASQHSFFFFFWKLWGHPESSSWAVAVVDVIIFSGLIVRMIETWTGTSQGCMDLLTLQWKCLVSLHVVFVVGLRGSLSKLISLQRPAKNRHPDCSVVHTERETHTHKGKPGKHAAFQVHVNAHVLHA